MGDFWDVTGCVNCDRLLLVVLGNVRLEAYSEEQSLPLNALRNNSKTHPILKLFAELSLEKATPRRAGIPKGQRPFGRRAMFAKQTRLLDEVQLCSGETLLRLCLSPTSLRDFPQHCGVFGVGQAGAFGDFSLEGREVVAGIRVGGGAEAREGGGGETAACRP